jgi:oxygen-dependent protoporphyrinogen oxidase
MKRIAVVGGGISGLTVAYSLINRGEELDVMVFESESRAGGKIRTDRSGGFLFERGANGFLDNKPKTLALCNDLGITPLRSNENAKKRYIFSGGELKALPESPPAFLRSNLISWSGKLRMLYELIAPRGPEEETVSDFILRRLGREALEKLIDPMVSGVFAGDPYRMSIKSCFPRIKELEKEYGSLIRAMIRISKERKKSKGSGVSVAPPGNLTSFYDGAQTITDALALVLGDRLKLGYAVKGLARLGGSARGGKKGNSYQLHTSEGIFDADVVVLASPAFVSSEILKDIDGNISKSLAEIPYPPLSIVCFGYKRGKVGHPLNGFGFLTPHIEGRRILGSLWDSSIFPNRAPDGHILLRTMVGGSKSPEFAMLDDDKLVSTVFDELKPLMSLKGEPDMVRIYRWEKAIPQYLLGHGERLRRLDEHLDSFPGLYLAGNALRGVGMNDCIENGYKVADRIMKYIND